MSQARSDAREPVTRELVRQMVQESKRLGREYAERTASLRRVSPDHLKRQSR